MTFEHGSDLRLEFSHNIIEHLGLKLYQNKPTNVIAELISNSWDADAENTWITVTECAEQNEHDIIRIIDDGYGMDLKSIREKYLVIGLKKRSSFNPAEKSAIKNRFLMGRKGIGKLAPFGIAGRLTVMTIYKSESGPKISVFSLDIDEMLNASESGSHGINSYPPEVIYLDVPIDKVDASLLDDYGYSDFCEKITNKGTGTCIHLSNLKNKKSISITRLIESVGRRFTVTISKSDFNVYINGILVEAKESLPTFDHRYPKEGYDTEIINVNGVDREVNSWVGFVEKASWPQDEAGVGVYAHGKIAQDRPFFFGVKGKEIYTRYMYGVVEADWLDELNEDVISTDRTSVNWESDDTSPLYLFCQQKVKTWVERFRKDHSPGAVDKLAKAMKEIPDLPRVTPAEQTAIVELVHKLGPEVHNNKEMQLEVIRAMTSSWTHKPMQVLVKKLWDAFEISENNTDAFTNSLKCLNEHLVPESLSMSVI
ncbi:TPA: ATP-binding protein, partial [Serratia fonticola]